MSLPPVALRPFGPLLLGAVLWVLARWILSEGVVAYHPKAPTPEPLPGPHSHLGSMNRATEWEDWCAYRISGDLDPGVDHTTLLNMLSDSLYAGDPNSDWNGVRGVDLAGWYGQCPGPGDNTAGLFELRFYFYNSLAAPVCNNPQVPNPAGCAEPSGASYLDPSSQHIEHRFFKIRLKPTTIATSANHEVGHALGLCDGGEDVYDTGPPCDLWGQHEMCVNSVMHSYGCPEPDWPTSQDIDSVENLIPVPGTSQGGSGGGCGGKAFSCGFFG